MQQRIDVLQTALKFDAPLQPEPALATTASAALATNASAELEAGLRHHAAVLRATQDKLDALEGDMTHLMATAAEHAETLAEMDVGLRNQKSEIEDAHHSLREHDERMGTGDAQLLQLASDLEQRQAERKEFEARCRASVASLRTDCDSSCSATAKLQGKYNKMSAGLRNHQDEIRSIRSAHLDSQGARSVVEHRFSELSAGLDNHRQEIRMLKARCARTWPTRSRAAPAPCARSCRRSTRALSSTRRTSGRAPSSRTCRPRTTWWRSAPACTTTARRSALCARRSRRRRRRWEACARRASR